MARRLGTGVPDRATVTRLQFAGDRIALETPGSGTLEIGSLQEILQLLRHEPATAAELEAAIAHVEDRLMPVVRLLPAERRLATSASEVRGIAKAAGLDNAAELTTEAVELMFNRLADVAYGTPAARLGLPPTRAFAASLLLLRELLHHGGFDAVEILRR